jgi:hypothetical protein
MLENWCFHVLLLINYNKSSCNRIEDQRSHQKDKLVFAANINRTSMKDDSLVYTISLLFIYCFIYISPLYLKLFLFNPFSFWPRDIPGWLNLDYRDYKFVMVTRTSFTAGMWTVVMLQDWNQSIKVLLAKNLRLVERDDIC